MNKKKTQSKTKSGSTKKKSPSVKELNEQINEKDKYVRLFAEFENYKEELQKKELVFKNSR